MIIYGCCCICRASISRDHNTCSSWRESFGVWLQLACAFVNTCSPKFIHRRAWAVECMWDALNDGNLLVFACSSHVHLWTHILLNPFVGTHGRLYVCDSQCRSFCLYGPWCFAPVGEHSTHSRSYYIILRSQRVGAVCVLVWNTVLIWWCSTLPFSTFSSFTVF